MYRSSPLLTPFIPHTVHTLFKNTGLVFKLFTPISNKGKKIEKHKLYSCTIYPYVKYFQTAEIR